MEVSGEKVKLHLDIDETQNKDKAAWFRYAPPTGNLMYSMPIVGTNANLYFSSERSEDPIVIGCIRKNGSSCESFSDVNNRYFSTESGNNLDMLPGAINFSRPGLSANFNDGSGINLSSSSSLNISAGYVGIYAGDITIKAKSKLEAKKGESSFISLENDFYNNAGIVMENGSDKASNGAFDDDPQKGAAEAKKAKAAMESAVKVALAAVVGAVQGAMGKIGECLAGVGNNASSTSNVDLRDTLNKPWANLNNKVKLSEHKEQDKKDFEDYSNKIVKKSLESLDYIVDGISKYTYMEQKYESKPHPIIESDNFKLGVDVLVGQGWAGLKVNILDEDGNFAPQFKMGVKLEGKMINFPYEFESVKVKGSEGKLDGELNLMVFEAQTSMNSGHDKFEETIEAIKLNMGIMGSFAQGKVDLHCKPNSENNAGIKFELEGDVGALGLEGKISNNTLGMKAADIIGGGYEVSIENKDDK